MLSIPEITTKQVLFIQAEADLSNKLRLENENIIYEKDGKISNKASVYRVLAIFIVGEFTITSKLIQKLLSFGISVFFLKINYKLYAAIEAKAEGNFLVRQRQYTASSTEECELAKLIVKQKIKNQEKLLKQIKNEVGIKQLDISLKQIEKAKNSKELLGIEGISAKIFFTEYFKNSNINWLRRLPQTKIDIPNLLLDIGYTYLLNFIDSLLRLYGFDTYKGIYHTLFFERKSLSCDLMEPFRFIVDKTLLKAYNLKQINEKDFSIKNGVYQLDWKNSGKYSQIFLTAILENKVEILKYIQGYYRYFMRPDKYTFPKIKI
jgi:CRISP-associated protein Cas1